MVVLSEAGRGQKMLSERENTEIDSTEKHFMLVFTGIGGFHLSDM